MISKSSEADAKRVLAAIVLGFSADPVVRWFFPEPQRFLAKFPILARLFGGRAFEHGTAYHLDGYIGAALWLPPNVHPDERALTELFQEEYSGEKLDATFALFEQMDAAHPDEPCYHLAFIAVDPSRQGEGYGSKILEHTLEVCDEENRLAYLESTNPTNISLYLRYGFELVGNIQSGDSPPLFPMIREPR